MASSLGAQRGTRYIPEALKRTKIIQLSNLPTTVIPADLRRLVIRGQVQGVEDASIEYHRLQPTGRAYLRLTHEDFFPNLDALEMVSVSGVHPIAEASAETPSPDESGGHGLSSELGCDGKDVVIWGLPRQLREEAVDRHLLGGFSMFPGEFLFKLPPVGFSLYSRFRVRLVSVSEAHRLVRKVHMTNYNPEVLGPKYQLRAQVVY
ncbi:hypothetical protein B0H17DRAFT_476579 [Mycena rosella]|uniref:Uncharacterized protein n=1 Tax=Mycena rosella TaxID=1033263 RepID=A0AAD7GGZ7_MYCRO|nr:hypothetical protein B0H17DRAFT_476579 [Mycena rosella]